MSKLQNLIDELCPDGVEFQELRKLVLRVDNIKWKDHTTNEYMYIDLTSVDRETHTITEVQTINYNTAPSRAQQIVKTGDVLFGTTRPMLKRYCTIGEKYDGNICSTGFCVLRADSSRVLSRWLYHIISSTAFFDHVDRFQQGASYPTISDADVKRYKIPVPPIPVQAEIVRILDAFTEVTAELTDKLTAELPARQKQYEYYRDKLLTFNNEEIAPPPGKIWKLNGCYWATYFIHATAIRRPNLKMNFGKAVKFHGFAWKIFGRTDVFFLIPSNTSPRKR